MTRGDLTVRKEVWQRYTEAKDYNWREAFGGWVEARDASLAAWASESAVVTGEMADRSPGGLSIISGVI